MILPKGVRITKEIIENLKIDLLKFAAPVLLRVTQASKEETKYLRNIFRSVSRQFRAAAGEVAHRDENFIKLIKDFGYEDLEDYLKGCDVHHRVPRRFGGTNDYSNLILIQKGVHTALHHYMDVNQGVRYMSDGESKLLAIPWWDGMFFPVLLRKGEHRVNPFFVRRIYAKHYPNCSGLFPVFPLPPGSQTNPPRCLDARVA